MKKTFKMIAAVAMVAAVCSVCAVAIGLPTPTRQAVTMAGTNVFTNVVVVAPFGVSGSSLYYLDAVQVPAAASVASASNAANTLWVIGYTNSIAVSAVNTAGPVTNVLQTSTSNLTSQITLLFTNLPMFNGDKIILTGQGPTTNPPVFLYGREQ